jgi:outer membrane receptor protein involved in Fe transport
MTVGAQNVVDLRLGARTGDLTVSLFAKNLFDDRAYLPPAFFFFNALGGPIDIKAPVLQPRTVGVSIDKSF